MPRSLTFSKLSKGEFFSFVRSDGETFLKVDNQHFEDHNGRRYRINDASEPVERES